MTLASAYYIALLENPLLTLTPQGGKPRTGTRLAQDPQPGDAERNKYLFMQEREREEMERQHLEKYGIFF